MSEAISQRCIWARWLKIRESSANPRYCTADAMELFVWDRTHTTYPPTQTIVLYNIFTQHRPAVSLRHRKPHAGARNVKCGRNVGSFSFRALRPNRRECSYTYITHIPILSEALLIKQVEEYEPHIERVLRVFGFRLKARTHANAKTKNTNQPTTPHTPSEECAACVWFGKSVLHHRKRPCM